jgi:hypothetical protein
MRTKLIYMKFKIITMPIHIGKREIVQFHICLIGLAAMPQGVAAFFVY